MSLLPQFDGSSWVYLVFVGALWGVTNPFLRRGSAGIENVRASNPILQTALELKFLFTRAQYLVPFLLNQAGSFVFFLALQQTELSLAGPIANTLTFLFTAIVGQLLGEQKANKETCLGVVLVLIGIFFCVMDKM